MLLTWGLQIWPIGRADRIDSIRTTTSFCTMVLTSWSWDMAKVQVLRLRKWSRSKLSASCDNTVGPIDSRYAFTSAVLMTFRASHYIT